MINDRTYRVRMNLERNPFPRGSFVHGSLVPWGGEWYWSGTQKTFDRLDAATIARLKAGLSQAARHLLPLQPGGPEEGAGAGPPAVRRVRDAARQGLGRLPRRAGDGSRLAEGGEGEDRLAVPRREEEVHGEARVGDAVAPDEISRASFWNRTTASASTSTPRRGWRSSRTSTTSCRGSRSEGADLTPGEEDAIRGWICEREASVRASSAAWRRNSGTSRSKPPSCWASDDEGYALEYLLRRYKGRFYRPRYPTLTIVK